TILGTFELKAYTDPEPDSPEFIVIDSIGFIEDMHPIILKAFHATLGELATADLVLLFVDASDPAFPLERKTRSCNQILREIDITSPTIVCANKMDIISSYQLEESVSTIRKYFINEDIVPVSIKTGQNLDKLLKLVKSKLQAQKLIMNPRNPEPHH